MAAKAALFSSSSMALLVTLSVLLNFWLYVLMIFAGAIVVLSFSFYYYARRVERERFWRSSVPSSPPSRPSRLETRAERRLRDKVEAEWDRQSAFGSPEDLR